MQRASADRGWETREIREGVKKRQRETDKTGKVTVYRKEGKHRE